MSSHTVWYNRLQSVYNQSTISLQSVYNQSTTS